MGRNGHLQLEQIHVNAQRPQRAEPHQLFSHPVPEPAPGFGQQRAVELTAVEAHLARHLERLLQGQHLTGTEQLHVHRNRTAAQLNMLQGQPLETGIPRREGHTIQTPPQQ